MRLIELIENYGEPISNNIFNELLSHEEDVLRLIFDAHISLKQLLNIEPVIREKFIVHSTAVVRLINEGYLDLKTILNLGPNTHIHLSRLAYLIVDVHVPLKRILALDPVILNQLFNKWNWDSVTVLLSQARVSFNILTTIDPKIRGDLLRNCDTVAQLITQANVSLTTLLSLTPGIRSQLLNEKYNVTLLIKESKISLETILAWDADTRLLIFKHSYTVSYWINEVSIPIESILTRFNGVCILPVRDLMFHLINEAGITREVLLTLAPEIRVELLTHCYAISRLINKAGVSLEILLTLNSDVRRKLICNSHAVNQLLNEAHIPLKELLDMPQSVYLRLLYNSGAVVELVKHVSISMEILLEFCHELLPYNDGIEGHYDEGDNRSRYSECGNRIYYSGLSARVYYDEESGKEYYGKTDTRPYDKIYPLFRAKQTYQYLIINGILTERQLVIGVLQNKDYFLRIQELVNENLIMSGILPLGHKLYAENISNVIKSLKGIAEIRKNSRVFYQASSQTTNNSTFFKIPIHLMRKISEFTGNDYQDESDIAEFYFSRPKTTM